MQIIRRPEFSPLDASTGMNMDVGSKVGGGGGGGASGEHRYMHDTVIYF